MFKKYYIYSNELFSSDRMHFIYTMYNIVLILSQHFGRFSIQNSSCICRSGCFSVNYRTEHLFNLRDLIVNIVLSTLISHSYLVLLSYSPFCYALNLHLYYQNLGLNSHMLCYKLTTQRLIYKGTVLWETPENRTSSIKPNVVNSYFAAIVVTLEYNHCCFDFRTAASVEALLSHLFIY